MVINQPTSKYFSAQNFGKRKRSAATVNSQPTKRQKMKIAKMRRMVAKILKLNPPIQPKIPEKVGTDSRWYREHGLSKKH